MRSRHFTRVICKGFDGAKLLTFLLTWQVFWRIARWLPLGVEARMRADLQKSKMDFATQSSEGKKWISTAHFPQYILRIHCKFGEPQGLGLHWTDMYRCQFFGLVTRWMSLSSGWNSPPRGWNPILSRGRSPCSPENGKNNQLLLRKFSRRCFLTIALNRVKGAEFFIRRESETFWPNVWSCSELHVAVVEVNAVVFRCSKAFQVSKLCPNFEKLYSRRVNDCNSNILICLKYASPAYSGTKFENTCWHEGGPFASGGCGSGSGSGK